MAFDPKKYLEDKGTVEPKAVIAQKTAIVPKAQAEPTGFDPNAYLANKSTQQATTATLPSSSDILSEQGRTFQPSANILAQQAAEKLFNQEDIGPKGFGATLEQEFSPLEATKKIPIAGAAFGILESAGTIQAAKRLTTGDYQADIRPVFSGQQSAVVPTKANDEMIIADAIKKASQEYTTGGKIAKGLSVLPTWMLEFAATGGLASLGDDAARKAGEKLLGKYVNTLAGKAALKTAGLTAGAVVRSSTGLLPRVVEKATGRQELIEIGLKGEEGWATSLIKAWGDTVIESFSEETGGLITKGLGGIAKRIPGGGKIVDALRKVWMKTTGGTADDFASMLLTKAGYSNILGEVGEEKLGALLREVTGVSDREGDFGERIWETLKEFADPEANIVEVATLLAPAAARRGLNLLAPKSNVRDQLEKATPDADGVRTLELETPDNVLKFKETSTVDESLASELDRKEPQDEGQRDEERRTESRVRTGQEVEEQRQRATEAEDVVQGQEEVLEPKGEAADVVSPAVAKATARKDLLKSAYKTRDSLKNRLLQVNKELLPFKDKPAVGQGQVDLFNQLKQERQDLKDILTEVTSVQTVPVSAKKPTPDAVSPAVDEFESLELEDDPELTARARKAVVEQKMREQAEPPAVEEDIIGDAKKAVRAGGGSQLKKSLLKSSIESFEAGKGTIADVKKRLDKFNAEKVSFEAEQQKTVNDRQDRLRRSYKTTKALEDRLKQVNKELDSSKDKKAVGFGVTGPMEQLSLERNDLEVILEDMKSEKKPKKPVTTPKAAPKKAAKPKLRIKASGDIVEVTPAQAAKEPEVTVTPKTPEIKKNVSKAVAFDPTKTTSARQADIAEDREALAMDEINSAGRKSWQKSLQQAEDEKIPQRAHRIADEVNKSPRALNDAETAGVVIRMAELKKEHAGVMLEIGKAKDKADIKTLSAEANRIEQEFDNLSRAVKTSGTEKGRALAAQKLTIDRDFRLISVLNRAKSAKRSNLSDKQKAEFTKVTEKLDNAVIAIENLTKEVAELKAKTIMKRGAKRFTSVTKAQRSSDRKTMNDRLTTLLEEGCNN